MTGKLPIDLMLEEYPDPAPLHPDDVVVGAESSPADPSGHPSSKRKSGFVEPRNSPLIRSKSW